MLISFERVLMLVADCYSPTLWAKAQDSLGGFSKWKGMLPTMLILSKGHAMGLRYACYLQT